jgi:hypothetical protein
LNIDQGLRVLGSAHGFGSQRSAGLGEGHVSSLHRFSNQKSYLGIKMKNWGFHLNAAFSRLGLKLAHFFLPTKATS